MKACWGRCILVCTCTTLVGATTTVWKTICTTGGSGPLSSFRQWWCVTWQSTLTSTSACGLTFRRLSLIAFLSCISWAVSHDQFQQRWQNDDIGPDPPSGPQHCSWCCRRTQRSRRGSSWCSAEDGWIAFSCVHYLCTLTDAAEDHMSLTVCWSQILAYHLRRNVCKNRMLLSQHCEISSIHDEQVYSIYNYDNRRKLPSRNLGANMLKRRQIIHDDIVIDRRQVNAGLYNASIMRWLKHVGLR